VNLPHAGRTFRWLIGRWDHGTRVRPELKHMKKMPSEEYRLNPETDLVPVCPNCHAMLHTSEPPLSVDELKAQLRSP